VPPVQYTIIALYIEYFQHIYISYVVIVIAVLHYYRDIQKWTVDKKWTCLCKC